MATSECGAVAEKLVQSSEIDEALVLSTCNRTELIASVRDSDLGAARLREFLLHEIGDGTLEPGQYYERVDGAAVEHVFRVAGSLDSMVLGEAQILGQVKQAYAAAARAQSVGPVLHRLLQRAFRCAKRMRTETGLGDASVSVARVGVQLAGELFESLAEKHVLLLGAGAMAESALHGLRDAGATSLVVVNRSRERARALAAQLGGRAAPLATLHDEVARSDVTLASAQVVEPLVRRRSLEPLLRQRHGRPLLIIDLGLPRNVESALAEVETLYLYDLDDLEAAARRGADARRTAIAPAERIVAQERRTFERWQSGLSAAEVLRDLVARGREIARTEAQRFAPPDAGSESARALERATQAAVAKLLHPALERVREEAEEGTGPYYSLALRELFRIGERPGSRPAGGEADLASRVSGIPRAEPVAGSRGGAAEPGAGKDGEDRED